LEQAETNASKSELRSRNEFVATVTGKIVKALLF
jgi:hypothetical protein